MRRKRVTGRFFLFLLALLVIAFLILRPRLFPSSKETVIMMANADQRQTVDCVIIRDESVTLSESTARVEYIAAEDSLVTEGTTVANLYATGYSESLLNALETTRKKIQDYHKQLLANIVDSQLQELDQKVNRKAIEFKNLITRQTIGNLKTVASQLETEMVRRQEYLRQNNAPCIAKWLGIQNGFAAHIDYILKYPGDHFLRNIIESVPETVSAAVAQANDIPVSKSNHRRISPFLRDRFRHDFSLVA